MSARQDPEIDLRNVISTTAANFEGLTTNRERLVNAVEFAIFQELGQERHDFLFACEKPDNDGLTETNDDDGKKINLTYSIERWKEIAAKCVRNMRYESRVVAL